jgi:F-type H+-transporting ATPase subunit b
MAVLQKLILMYLLLINSAYAAEGMPQFNAKTFPSQLFWLVISFLVLYFFITFLVLPRIRENIRLRKNKISNDIERAENLRDQTEKILTEYNKKIEVAKTKAKNLIKNSAKKADEDLNIQMAGFKKQIDKKLSATELQLNEYKKESLKKLSESSSNVASVIIKKIFSNNLEDKRIAELITSKKELT